MPNLIFSKNLCGFAYPQGSHNRLTLLKDSTVVCGEGHILVAKPNRKPGSYLNIVIPSVRLLFTAICLSNSVQNEQFYVDEPSGEPEVNSQVSPDPVPVPAVLETPTIQVETEAAAVSNYLDPVETEIAAVSNYVHD